ncbi:solute carrier family 53 member 1 isoform X3 [Dermacentor variabilis]|uniref:solute carrier family 53 member 1 isoform X3 n=1 Tax=Dermacentor variabilis TaxID=34621 RepID=UPI003F5B770F
MKFTEHLAAHITPEWRKQYILYEEMKTMLYGAVERAPSAEVVEQSIITRYLASFDEEFFQYCDKELAKINTFYSEKLAEATRKFSNLKSELNNYISKLESHRLNSNVAAAGGGRLGLMRAFDRQAQEVKIHTRKIHDLKLAFSEFYLSLILLQNYQNLNFTGFRKILKKHDKLLGTNLGAQWRQGNVEAAPFYTNKDIDRLIQETESLVTSMLEGGDRQKAMKRLRVPPLGDQQSPWVTFKVGLFSGAYIVLIIAVILSGVFSQTRDDWRIVFRLYRGTLLIILFMFLIGVNVYGWRTSGVNHVLIFELDPRNHLSEQHLMEMAAIFGVLWALSVLAFLYSGPLAIPTYANPLALLLLMLVFLVNPLHTMRHQARFWLLRVLGRIFAAPFFYVGFADFWLADQLNSLVPVFIDAQYFVCFYATDFQWMENSDSYPSSSSHPFFILWILSAVVSSCFTYTWDIRMDWGLFDSNAGENRFLREEIVYSSSGYYYFAILTDLALRFGWTLSVSLTELGVIHSDLMVTILAPLEVFRRFVWNFFRLENEHLNNCGKFRAVRDISVAPIDAGNQALLVRMMDEPCGVVNRGGRRDLRKRANKHKKSSPETKILLETAEGDDTVDV